MSSLWLNEHRNNITSQNGEDGVLEAIFERLGVLRESCCEFGAWDGIQFSNTRQLVKQGWKAVLIEADAHRFGHLVDNCRDYAVVAKNCLVNENINNILADTPLPFDFDLLSIDVDDDHGVEVVSGWAIWKALTDYRPRVVVIEVNSSFALGEVIMGEQGTSLEAMVILAKSKGYELALHTGNAIFVTRELAPLLGVDPDNWQELFDRSYL